MRASFVLTPPESKRLIAKAIIKTNEIKKALEKAYIILCEGTINVMIAQELFGLNIKSEDYICGVVMDGVTCTSGLSSKTRIEVTFKECPQKKVWVPFPLVAYKGKIVDISYHRAINDFHIDTLVIKGGNAIDKEKNVGVILGGYDGGITAKVMGHCISQGTKLICPIGLEKTVFSVREAANYTGGKRFNYSMGSDYGLIVVSNAFVVTEIEAIKILSGADAFHVASGGIGGSEGAVVLSCEGTLDEVKSIINIIEGIKGEPPQKGKRQDCNNCRYVNCIYYGKQKNNLPEWLI